MAEIFTTRPGSIAIIQGNGAIPGSVEIRDVDGASFAFDRVIITAIGYNQSCNAQFLQTLDNSIYIYSFGDRIGEIQVQGLAFASTACGSDNGSGVADILDYYKSNRLSATGKPIRIAVGTEVIKGYLIGCRILTQNVETMTYAWVLEIAAIPDQTDAAVGA